MKPTLVAALLITSLSSPSIAHADELSGIPRIIDGDTIDLQDIRIRLHGIDAPEAGQKCKTAQGGSWKCGDAALERLVSLVQDGVTCHPTGADVYDRWLAVCHQADGTDINKVMVEEGYAWAFVRYSEDYAAAEETAKALKSGIWQADTETAWDYRAAKWQVAEQESPDGCPIKGNISKGGQIYHAPWSPWYKKTKVSVEKGERWFCTEREAIDAGWRAPVWR